MQLVRMLFRDVIGQKPVIQNLIRSVQEGRISHAQMLFGPEGAGKLPLALAYSRYILCTSRTAEDACGHCVSCQKISKLIHPDLHFVFPVFREKTAEKVTSEKFLPLWRSFLQNNPYFSYNQWMKALDSENKQGMIFVEESAEILRKLSLKPYESDWKVMIIWLPERMHPAAANKLLKILEEPPDQTLFLLISENTQTILPTILSRVQMIRVPRLPDSDIEKALTEKYAVDQTRARRVALQAGGNFARALSLLSLSAEDQQFDRFVTLMRLVWKKNISEILGWVDELASVGREEQKEFLQYALTLVRENLLLNLKLPFAHRLTEPELEFSRKFSAFIHPDNIEQIHDAFSKAQTHIEANAYDKLVLFDLALSLSEIIRS
ncbi:MAG TPA: DNA polymerase III subunit delta' [Bacteroidales bacterium]|nr:DNA polymerase III subunit delta' [Bacteroidales bacterium]